jgi:hypothetical protein
MLREVSVKHRRRVERRRFANFTRAFYNEIEPRYSATLPKEIEVGIVRRLKRDRRAIPVTTPDPVLPADRTEVQQEPS